MCVCVQLQATYKVLVPESLVAAPVLFCNVCPKVADLNWIALHPRYPLEVCSILITLRAHGQVHLALDRPCVVADREPIVASVAQLHTDKGELAALGDIN